MADQLRATERQRPASLLTEREAASILGFTQSALQAWRLKGGGPRFVKISARAVRYRLEDLEVFVEERLRTSTADPGPAGA